MATAQSGNEDYVWALSPAEGLLTTFVRNSAGLVSVVGSPLSRPGFAGATGMAYAEGRLYVLNGSTLYTYSLLAVDGLGAAAVGAVRRSVTSRKVSGCAARRGFAPVSTASERRVSRQETKVGPPGYCRTRLRSMSMRADSKRF